MLLKTAGISGKLQRSQREADLWSIKNCSRKVGGRGGGSEVVAI